MRSSTPKLLHPLCGRPMIGWPLAAARERAPTGSWSSSARRAAALIPDADVEVVVQEQPRGTGDAVRAAARLIEPDATVLVIHGDVPLISAQTLAALAAHHDREGAAATMLTAVLEDPSGYGRVVRAIDGHVERVVETKVPGDATELELQIREVNTGMFAFEGAALLAALEQVGAHNAQGEHYLPDVLPVIRANERSVLAHELADPTRRSGSTTAASSRRSARSRSARSSIATCSPA